MEDFRREKTFITSIFTSQSNELCQSESVEHYLNT